MRDAEVSLLIEKMVTALRANFAQLVYSQLRTNIIRNERIKMNNRMAQLGRPETKSLQRKIGTKLKKEGEC